jgi:hypothetical protein
MRKSKKTWMKQVMTIKTAVTLLLCAAVIALNLGTFCFAHTTYAQPISSTQVQNIYIEKIWMSTLPTAAIAIVIALIQFIKPKSFASSDQ